jgi:hypothetical protein
VRLHVLDAIDADGDVTDLGRAMAALPLEPDLARALLAACEFGCVRGDGQEGEECVVCCVPVFETLKTAARGRLRARGPCVVPSGRAARRSLHREGAPSHACSPGPRGPPRLFCLPFACSRGVGKRSLGTSRHLKKGGQRRAQKPRPDQVSPPRAYRRREV